MMTPCSHKPLPQRACTVKLMCTESTHRQEDAKPMTTQLGCYNTGNANFYCSQCIKMSIWHTEFVLAL